MFKNEEGQPSPSVMGISGSVYTVQRYAKPENAGYT